MIATQLLIEKVETFLVSDLNAGKVSQPQMKILRQDPSPVQRNYSYVARTMYTEIKGYVQDLLNRGWIVSSQPSDFVVVCKKERLVKLCCDY